MPQDISPLIEELLAKIPDSRTLAANAGLPHPLWKFAIDSDVADQFCADTILEFIKASVFAEEGSPRHNAALWFLLDSDKTFFFICAGAGIDAEKLREHLRKTISKEE
jgi:hypothetical protein